MKTSESGVTQGEVVMEEPHAALEKVYIEEYLHSKGHTMQSWRELSEEEARQLMREASMYASTKLAEVETKTHLVQELHGTSERAKLGAV